MKRLTTIICGIALMIAGAYIAEYEAKDAPDGKRMMAATLPEPLSWKPGNVLPLDLQLDLDKRLSHEFSIKDSIRIIDSVRYVDKVRIKWKTRYKNVADRTTAREAGNHLSPVNPDSLMEKPAITSTVGREEQPTDYVGPPNGSSIQLTVDGEVVYSRNVNHSTGESQ